MLPGPAVGTLQTIFAWIGVIAVMGALCYLVWKTRGRRDRAKASGGKEEKQSNSVPIIPIEWDAGIVCKIPLTRPTGKTRVKTNELPRALFDKPQKGSTKGSTSDPFSKGSYDASKARGDYIEWQISYLNEKVDPPEPIEALRMVLLGYRNGMIAPTDYKNLKAEISGYTEFIEDFVRLQNEALLSPEKSELTFSGFNISIRRSPVFEKAIAGDTFIRVTFQPKQRAVGSQAMLYVWIPIQDVTAANGQSLVGSKASHNQEVMWKPSAEVAMAILRALALLSRADQKKISERL